MSRAAAVPLDPALPPSQALAAAPEGARALWEAVQVLYGGDWDAGIEDQRRRAAGRPYLFRLGISGIDVLGWLQALKAYGEARRQASSVALTEDAP